MKNSKCSQEKYFNNDKCSSLCCSICERGGIHHCCSFHIMAASMHFAKTSLLKFFQLSYRYRIKIKYLSMWLVKTLYILTKLPLQPHFPPHFPKDHHSLLLGTQQHRPLSFSKSLMHSLLRILGHSLFWMALSSLKLPQFGVCLC